MSQTRRNVGVAAALFLIAALLYWSGRPPRPEAGADAPPLDLPFLDPNFPVPPVAAPVD